jgi:hypothetical protein
VVVLLVARAAAAGSDNLLVVVHLPAKAGPADRTIPAANTSSTSKLAVLRGVPVDDAGDKQAQASSPIDPIFLC